MEIILYVAGSIIALCVIYLHDRKIRQNSAFDKGPSVMVILLPALSWLGLGLYLLGRAFFTKFPHQK